MIRSHILIGLALAGVFAAGSSVTFAQSRTSASPASGANPNLVASHGDWGAYVTQSGRAKVCYALTQPKTRKPDNLRRDPAYIFISTRPAEGVRGEVSIMLGFPLRENDSVAEIGDAKFELVTQGSNAWIRNAAEESQFVDAMRRGATLTIKAYSTRGNLTTDSYSLAGVSAALDRVQRECR